MKTSANKVKIIVVDSVGVKDIMSYHRSDGKIFSTVQKINVNRTPYGFSVLIKSDDLDAIDTSKYSASILKLFMKYLPNTMFSFTLDYYYETPDDWFFNAEVAKKVLGWNYFLGQVNDMNRIQVFEFSQNDDKMEELTSNIEEMEEDDEDEYDTEDYESYDDEEDEEEDENDVIDPFKFLMNGSYSMSKRKKKSKRRRNDYDIPKSRSIRNAHRPKRAINRHGIIIADSKADIRKDEKIIKAFLKEFIPGDGWKKRYRQEVLDRWVSSYVIDKKRLNKMQKKHRKHSDKNHRSRLGSAVSRMLLANDVWNNPNK